MKDEQSKPFAGLLCDFLKETGLCIAGVPRTSAAKPLSVLRLRPSDHLLPVCLTRLVQRTFPQQVLSPQLTRQTRTVRMQHEKFFSAVHAAEC